MRYTIKVGGPTLNTKRIITTYKDLVVYQVSFLAAKQIFVVSKRFPKEETYSLTDQLRRSTRSIPVNIAEGWAKRKYKNVFIRHLNDANGSCEETKVWLDFARDCLYIAEEEHKSFLDQYNKIGAMLFSLMKRWQNFDKRD
ncbi:MAG: four helix bundle protein [Candidatus Omnitrophica bacterium]|nr:four helix bundle protein [Candidatus Omnitrophota bacterium]